MNTKNLMPALIGGVAGGVVSAALDAYVMKSLSETIRDGVKLAAGIALPMFVKGNAMVAAAGDSMIGVAAYNLSKAYIPGMSGIGTLDRQVISGPGAKAYFRSVAATERPTGMKFGETVVK